MTGHYRPTSETPFIWRLTSGPIMAPAFSGIWILSPPFKHKKKFSELSWTPFDKTFWIRACYLTCVLEGDAQQDCVDMQASLTLL